MSPRTRQVWRKILVATSAAQVVLSPGLATADGDATAPAEAIPDRRATVAPAPPALTTPFLQYGVAFTTEFVASAGPLCNATAGAPCILGSGGGVVFPRVGWRSASHWYLGGAYEISKQDAGTLYRLPILQQLRAEARYYLLDGHVVGPYLEGTVGLAGYGNEWTVDTYGPALSVALGVETQISRRSAIGASFAYRVIHFSSFTDAAAAPREAGFAQLVGLNILLEVRDPY